MRTPRITYTQALRTWNSESASTIANATIASTSGITLMSSL